MTERIIEHGIEIAKTEGLLVAVTEVKKDTRIDTATEQDAIKEIVTQGIDEDIFIDEHVREARRAAIIARNALKHRQKSRRLRRI